MRYKSRTPSFETPPPGLRLPPSAAPQDDAEFVETASVMMRSGAKPRDRKGDAGDRKSDAGVSNHAGRCPYLLSSADEVTDEFAARARGCECLYGPVACRHMLIAEVR